MSNKVTKTVRYTPPTADKITKDTTVTIQIKTKKNGVTSSAVEKTVKLTKDYDQLVDMIHGCDKANSSTFYIRGSTRAEWTSRAQNGAYSKATTDEMTCKNVHNTLVEGVYYKLDKGNATDGPCESKFNITVKDKDDKKGYNFDVSALTNIPVIYSNDTAFKFGTGEPGIRVIKKPTKTLHPFDNSDTIQFDGSSATCFSLDPQIAYVEYADGTNQLDGSHAKSTGAGNPVTCTVKGRRNGIARISVRITNTTAIKPVQLIFTVKCDGFEETYVEKPLVNKFYVLACLGQSMSVGYDNSKYNEDEYKYNHRIAQLGYWSKNLQAVPLTTNAETCEYMPRRKDWFGPHPGTRGIHYAIAKRILEKIPEDYGVLIVPVAFGNTGFSGGIVSTFNANTLRIPQYKLNGVNNPTWKWNNALSRTAVERIKKAVALNPENKFMGIIWSQGEYDYGKTSIWTTEFTKLMSYYEQELANIAMVSGTGFKFKKHCFTHSSARAYGEFSGRNGAAELHTKMKEMFGNRYALVSSLTAEDDTKGSCDMNVGWGSHIGNNAYETKVAPEVFKKMQATYGENLDFSNVVESGSFTPVNTLKYFTINSVIMATSKDNKQTALDIDTNIPLAEITFDKDDSIFKLDLPNKVITYVSSPTDNTPKEIVLKWEEKTIGTIVYCFSSSNCKNTNINYSLAE